MASIRNTTKRFQIDKANTTMVLVIAISSFLVTFSLVAAKTLWSQRGYQARVIKEKEIARNQIRSNIQAASSLTGSYKEFIGKPNNILGGNPNGTGDHDGDNGRIILDALPSKYDFPALATSVDKLLSGGDSFKLISVAGTDDELNQGNKASAEPQVVEIPLTLSIEGSFKGIQSAVSTLGLSIRPINIQSINMSGSDDKLKADIIAKTYYQPAKNLSIETKVVK